MIHERLEKLRKLRGISKAELARQIKIPPTTYSGYAMGKREPDLHTIGLFSEFYGVSVDYLVNGKDGNEFKKAKDKFFEEFQTLSIDDQKTIVDLVRRMKKK